MVRRMLFPIAPRDWYVFRVRSRHEKLVSASLRRNGYEEFLPLTKSRRKWADRFRVIEIPLFPGYIFCYTERPQLGRILCTYGIIDVVRAGSFPIPANRAEIENLRTATEAKLKLESYSYIDPATSKQLRIMSGPLTGLEGMVVEVRGKERLILSVELLRRSVLVELPVSCVGFCEEKHPSSSDVPEAA